MKTNRWMLSGLAALCVTAVALVGCGDDDADPAATNTARATGATQPTAAATSAGGSVASALSRVDVADNDFTPANLTVPAGTKVTWTWSGSNPHSVVGTFSGQAVDSQTKRGVGMTFEATFDKAGTFEYICGVHGASMSGKVTVT